MIMQITCKPSRRGNEGYLLVMTLCFLVVCLVSVGIILSWASNGTSLNARNNLFVSSESAAEAGTEIVMSQMQRDFGNQSLNSASSYTSLTPSQTGWPVQFQFSDTNGNAGSVSVIIGTTNWVYLNSQYAGLQGTAQACTIISTATPLSQRYALSATVNQQIEFASIPVFQFAIFYNMNLEIDPGQDMAINGPVFSNAGIWAGSANLTFNSSITAVGQVYTNYTAASGGDPFATSYPGNGNPLIHGAVTSQANALSMPIGTNNSPSSI
jgi:hypothetical protein